MGKLSYFNFHISVFISAFNFQISTYSTVVKDTKTNLILDQDKQSNSFNLLVSVDYFSATLTKSHYNEHQHFLFNSIHQMRQEGKNYQEISDILSAAGHKSPTGKPLNNRIVWSIHKKRLRRLEKRARKFEPEIRDVKIEL